MSREDSVLRFEIEKVGIGAGRVLVAVGAAGEDVDERVGMSDGNRPQQHGIDQREHRRVDADAEAEREDGDERRNPALRRSHRIA